MKINIGLVGPHDTVEYAIKVGEEFNSHIQLQPFVYQQIEEAPDIVASHVNQIDIWIFTGRLPYQLASQQYPKLAMQCIPSTGSALMKQLFYIRQHHLDPSRISIEAYQKEMIVETFSELGLSSDQLHILDSTRLISTEDVVSFHASKYEEGLVDACVTYRSSVYEKLQLRGIPVYRIIPTRMSIRQTFELACQQGETDLYKKSQVALLVIQSNQLSQLNENYYESYLSHLKIQEMVLKYAQTLSGSFFPVNDERFIIFSARGVIEQDANHLPDALLQQIKAATNADAYCGIGYGQTVLEAERHATLALQHARERNAGRTAIVDERGNISDPLYHEGQFVYNYRSEDAHLLSKLKQAGINIATYNRILSLQNGNVKKSLSAADVAQWLDMTQRNANRILTQLHLYGLADVIGQEKPSAKGRPRNVYRIGPH